MNCKVRIIKDYKFIDYTCDDIRRLKDEWIEEFIEKNRCYLNKNDGRLMEYKKDIEDILDKCKCYDLDNCNKCSKEDHEGRYCRCEMRNIYISRKLRELNNSYSENNLT